jgi:hypothetical protein
MANRISDYAGTSYKYGSSLPNKTRITNGIFQDDEIELED